MTVIKILLQSPDPLGKVKGQVIKFCNEVSCQYFTEIPHADRGRIDMKHIKQYFSLRVWVRPPWVDLEGGAETKIQLFQNIVMLHIKLKEMTYASTWKQIFCP